MDKHCFWRRLSWVSVSFWAQCLSGIVSYRIWHYHVLTVIVHCSVSAKVTIIRREFHAGAVHVKAPAVTVTGRSTLPPPHQLLTRSATASLPPSAHENSIRTSKLDVIRIVMQSRVRPMLHLMSRNQSSEAKILKISDRSPVSHYKRESLDRCMRLVCSSLL